VVAVFVWSQSSTALIFFRLVTNSQFPYFLSAPLPLRAFATVNVAYVPFIPLRTFFFRSIE